MIRSRRKFDIDDAVRLGIEDRDPTLIQNWCRHLKIELVSTSALGQMIRLPTLGRKKLSCPYARYQTESVSIMTAAHGFIRRNCLNCRNHEQISPLNFVTIAKPWGWILESLFRIRVDTIRFIMKHSSAVTIALILLPTLFLSFVFLTIKNVSLQQLLKQFLQIFTSDTSGDNKLLSIAQINATVFALAFTIPIAATQLEKYRSEIPMFRGYHLYYMLFFILSIFFPIFSPSDSTLGYSISLIFSIACLLLLIPYLRWIKERLNPLRIICSLEEMAISYVNSLQEEKLKATIERIDELIIKSLSEKDYGIFGKAFEVLPKISRHCFVRRLILTEHPPQGYIYVGREITRIAELAIDDRTAMQIVSEKILLFDTMHIPTSETDETTFPLKMMEFTTLSWLTRFAIEQKESMSAMHCVASLLKTASPFVYVSDDGQKLVTAYKLQTIKFLLTIPENIVEWAYSLNENEYKMRYGEGLLKIALLGQIAEFYLQYKEKLREQKEGPVWDY